MTDSRGAVVEKPAKPAAARMLEAGRVYLINLALERAVTSGTAHAAPAYGLPTGACGKTGTTDDAGHFFKRLDMRAAVNASPESGDKPVPGVNAVVIGFCGDGAPAPGLTHDATVRAFAATFCEALTTAAPPTTSDREP